VPFIRLLLGLLVVLTAVTGWWSFRSASGYPSALLIVLVIGTACAALTLTALARDRRVEYLVGAVLTAILLPTFFAYLANLGLIVVVVFMVIIGQSRRRHA
jgi:hypothetical protein